MLREVEIRTAMNAFNLLKAKWHLEFNIRSCIGIMSQFLVIMEAIFLIAQTECFVPFQAEFTPMIKPFKFRTGLNEKLHLHLLKLAHAEYKLACNNLISECFTNLSNTKRQLHTPRLLHIQVINKYALSSLRT